MEWTMDCCIVEVWGIDWLNVQDSTTSFLSVVDWQLARLDCAAWLRNYCIVIEGEKQSSQAMIDIG